MKKPPLTKLNEIGTLTDDSAKSNRICKVKKRLIPTVFAAVTVATGGLTLGTATPGGTSEHVAIVDRLMSYPLEEFVKERNRSISFEGPTQIDWSNDGCSGPARGTGVTFDFNNACIRHDFGYRNYKALGLLTEDKRGDVDKIFYNDMKEHCSTRSILLKPGCYAAAERYYRLVRRFGASAAGN